MPIEKSQEYNLDLSGGWTKFHRPVITGVFDMDVKLYHVPTLNTQLHSLTHSIPNPLTCTKQLDCEKHCSLNEIQQNMQSLSKLPKKIKLCDDLIIVNDYAFLFVVNSISRIGGKAMQKLPHCLEYAKLLHTKQRLKQNLLIPHYFDEHGLGDLTNTDFANLKFVLIYCLDATEYPDNEFNNHAQTDKNNLFQKTDNGDYITLCKEQQVIVTTKTKIDLSSYMT